MINMSIVVRYYPTGLTPIYLHFSCASRKDRATRQKSQIAVASGAQAFIYKALKTKDKTRFSGNLV
jgi:hypothetical protein